MRPAGAVPLHSQVRPPRHGGPEGCPVRNCPEDASWWLCINCGSLGCRKHQQFNGRIVTACWSCSQNYQGFETWGELAVGREYERPCNKCGVQITMQQGPNGKWGAYEFQSNESHRCGETSTPQKPVTSPPTTQVTQQPSLPGSPVMIGGMTKDVENWLENLVRRIVKEEVKGYFDTAAT